MAVIPSMLGNWQRGYGVEAGSSDELFLPNSLIEHHQNLQNLMQKPERPPPEPPISPKNFDELFFNLESQNEASSPPYLIFEPIVSSVSETEIVDWRRYEPPQELLRHQEETPNEIRGILKSSIAAIQSRHAEEEQAMQAAARRSKPLGRSKRASLKPKIEVTMSGALDPSLYPSSSRPNISSVSSTDSTDSGYGSRQASGSNSPESSSTTEKNFFAGITSRLKHKRVEIAVNPFEKLGEMATLAMSIFEAPKATSQVVPETDDVAIGPTTAECVSCLDDFPMAEMVKLSCHSYCGECFQRLISNALGSETHWPVRCCLNTIPSTTILPHLSTKTEKQYRDREAEWSVLASDRVYCSTSTCGSFIPPIFIDTKTRCASCPKCSHKTCVTCRGTEHIDADCPQDPALVATINLAEAEGWKRCYSCNAYVEHNKGCRHMTCRCKAQFCYICGLRWRTCACTEAQHAEIQEAARARRAEHIARTVRQTAHEEEERTNVRLVEEFIRQEEVRHATEAQAAREAEEARRHAEEEARRQEEEARVVILRTKYRLFAGELENLHDYQRSLMSERYEFESQVLLKDKSDHISTLLLRHTQESESLLKESQQKIEDLENRFEREYQIRFLEERRIEEKYVEELRVYWSDKKGGAFKVREERDNLRQEQDKEFKLWDNFRRSKLMALEESEKMAREFLIIKHRSEIKEVEGRSKIDEVEGTRRREAESSWLGALINERVTLLQVMEREELEGAS